MPTTLRETELTLGLTGKKVFRDSRHPHADGGIINLVESGESTL